MLVNFVNVLAVLWSAQAGRALALHVLYLLEERAPLAAAVAWLLRLVVALGFVCMAGLFGYALATLYLASPVFLCAFGSPSFGSMAIKGLPQVLCSSVLYESDRVSAPFFLCVLV